MSNKFNKVLFFIYFTLQLSCVFACTDENLEQSLNAILAIDKQILSDQYNRAFLENKKNEVIEIENQISNCIQKNLDTINHFKNIQKNLEIINSDNHKITLYQESIEIVKNNNKFCEKILNASQTVIKDIQEKFKKAEILEQTSIRRYDIKTLLLNYKATDKKIIFKSIPETFPRAVRIYKTSPGFFYGLILCAVLFFCSGFLILYVLKNISIKVNNQNFILFLYYIKHTIPWYCFIIPFEIHSFYLTKNLLITPNLNLIIDFLFRTLNIYLLAQFAVCFFIKNASIKKSAIQLLNQTILFVFIMSCIQTCYNVFLDKTVFIQLFYMLFFLPVFVLFFNYYIYKWARLPILSMNYLQTKVFYVTCFTMALGISLFRIITTYTGSFSISITQFILAILIFFYYIKVIQFQLNYFHFSNEKFNVFFLRIKERLFGNDINQAYEATIFVVAMNVIIAFYTLSFLMNILNIPDLYKYELFRFSTSKIEIGNLEIAIKEIIVAGLFFSAIMMTENILSHHFLIKKVDPISSNMFITKKNIIHYFFLVLAIIVSMLILKISSSQIIILLGGIGFGLGFGLKFVIENLISGLLIILNKVIFVGENIQIISDGADMIAEGRVLDIYSMNTVIVEMNNEKIIVPNSIISKNTIKKITHFENHSIDHQE